MTNEASDADTSYAKAALRILVILDTRTGQLGGVEISSDRFAQALLAAGHHIELLLVGQRVVFENAHRSSVPIHVVDAPGLETVAQGTWDHFLRASCPDVVVLAKGWFDRRSRALDTAIITKGCRYIVWENHPPPHLAQTPIGRAVAILRGGWGGLQQRRERQRHWAAADRVWCVSEYVHDKLVCDYGLDPSKAETIRTGVDLSHFYFDVGLKHAARTRWGIPHEACVIGALGRLVPHKRIDLLLRAFALVMHQQDMNPTYCVIAGVGPESVALQRLAKELNIEDFVRFLGWVEDPREAYCGFDLFCMPSADEGLGLVLVEAGACGCIPIAADVGGMPEVLESLGQQLIVRDSSIESWSTRLHTHLTYDTTETERLRKRIREGLTSRFDATRQWARMMACIEVVMRMPQRV